MKASAPKRNYFRIQKNLLRLSKTALLSLFIFATVLGNITPAFAQTPNGPYLPASFASDQYQTYLDLFGVNRNPNPTDIKSGADSGLVYLKTLEANEVPGGFSIKKIAFGVSLKFNDQDVTNTKLNWEKVSSDYRLAGNAADCTVAGASQLKPHAESFLIRFYAVKPDGTQNTLLPEVVQKVPFKPCIAPSDLQAVQNGTPNPYLTKYIRGDSFIESLGNTFKWLRTDTVGTLGVYVNAVQTAQIELNIPAPFDKEIAGQKVGADLWYCTGYGHHGTQGIPDGTAQNVDLTTQAGGPQTERIRYFDGYCDNGKNASLFDELFSDTTGDTESKKGSYAQIGGSVVFTLPKNISEVQVEQADTGNNMQAVSGSDRGVLPSCDITGSSGTFLGCIALVVYYVLYWPLQWIAGIFGQLFDFFLGYSLDDASYRADFAVRGWQLVRDISNIFFIIILVWTGLSAVFNTSGNNMKRVVPMLILNALLINFSLFATRVVIDISNITARVFYNSVEVCEGKCETKDSTGQISNIKEGVGGYKPLSEKIVSAFNPQKIFSAKVLDPSNVTNISNQKQSSQSSIANNSSGTIDSIEYAGFFIIVSIIAAIIMLTMAMMFWKIAFIFLGRVIGLYIAMIFAPFAVITKGNMPLVGSVKELSWDSWVNDLTKYAILAPIFVFFLYIIYSFLDSDFLKIFPQDMQNASFFTNIISVTVPMLIVYFMIKQGTDIAKKFSGKIGEMVQAGAMKVVGAGVGLAAGGAAFAGRNVIGRTLGAIGKQEVTYKNEKGEDVKTTRAAQWAANSNNSFLARKWNNTFSATQTGSWDARNLGAKIGGKEYKAGESLFKGLGLSDTVSGVVGIGADKALGKDGKPGGNVMINKKRDEARQKELENRVSMSHLSDDDAKAAGAKYKNDKAKDASEKNWEDHVDVEDIAKNSQTYKDLKQKEADLQQALATSTSGAAKATYEQALKQNKAAQDQTVQQVKDLKKNNEAEFQQLKLQTIEELKKDKKYQASDGYKTAGTKEFERLDKYGKIKDNKSFTNMMRAEYVEDLKKSSFWGDLRTGSGIAGMLGTMIPILGPAIGTVLGGVFAKQLTDDFIDSATGSRARAIKAIIKKATAAPGTGNTLVDLEARLQKHKDEALEAINTALNTKYTSYDDVLPKDAEEGVLRRIASLEEEVDKWDEVKKNTTGKEREDAIYEKAKAKKSLESLRKMDDKLAQAQKNLDEKKDREKDKEDREKNKPKDEKK